MNVPSKRCVEGEKPCGVAPGLRSGECRARGAEHLRGGRCRPCREGSTGAQREGSEWGAPWMCAGRGNRARGAVRQEDRQDL